MLQKSTPPSLLKCELPFPFKRECTPEWGSGEKGLWSTEWTDIGTLPWAPRAMLNWPGCFCCCFMNSGFYVKSVAILSPPCCEKPQTDGKSAEDDPPCGERGQEDKGPDVNEEDIFAFAPPAPNAPVTQHGPEINCPAESFRDSWPIKLREK